MIAEIFVWFVHCCIFSAKNQHLVYSSYRKKYHWMNDVWREWELKTQIDEYIIQNFRQSLLSYIFRDSLLTNKTKLRFKKRKTLRKICAWGWAGREAREERGRRGRRLWAGWQRLEPAGKCGGGKILGGRWPKNWNVTFKLFTVLWYKSLH